MGRALLISISSRRRPVKAAGGTRAWLSPEVLGGALAQPAADLFGLGASLAFGFLNAQPKESFLQRFHATRFLERVWTGPRRNPRAARLVGACSRPARPGGTPGGDRGAGAPRCDRAKSPPSSCQPPLMGRAEPFLHWAMEHRSDHLAVAVDDPDELEAVRLTLEFAAALSGQITRGLGRVASAEAIVHAHREQGDRVVFSDWEGRSLDALMDMLESPGQVSCVSAGASLAPFLESHLKGGAYVYLSRSGGCVRRPRRVPRPARAPIACRARGEACGRPMRAIRGLPGRDRATTPACRGGRRCEPERRGLVVVPRSLANRSLRV